MQSLVKIDNQPKFILLKFQPNGDRTFVDFLIVMNPSYMATRLKNVNNKLGMDQKNTGLNFAGSVMKGKSINHFYHDFENLCTYKDCLWNFVIKD